MKCSLGISNFLEEISSLSHSTVFLYFFALTTEEGFLISPYYSLELCIQMGISFFFSSPITSWQIYGETMETVRDFIFLGSNITADGDFSHEIKRHFLLERKAMTNLDSLLKSRDITLLTTVHLVKAMVFPVVMYGCESWTIKKAEHWRMDAFEL